MGSKKAEKSAVKPVVLSLSGLQAALDKVKDRNSPEARKLRAAIRKLRPATEKKAKVKEAAPKAVKAAKKTKKVVEDDDAEAGE